MIGVDVQPAEREMAGEFFELFKTPWEFVNARTQYAVLICTGGPRPVGPAKLVLIFSGVGTPFDQAHNLAVNSQAAGGIVAYAGRQLPIYGAAATFPTSPTVVAREATTREPAVHAEKAGEATFIRIGYNLFAETHHLLTSGQPVAHAGTPTLELHIALVRELITRAGLPLVEIPPVPMGHDFMACLTHDMDHPVLRNHFCDHTMFGFIYRASIGSLINLVCRRMTFAGLWENWSAVGRLPFVYLGMARDFWLSFDRYLEIEAGLGATYFVIPIRDYPGRKADGPAPAIRACRYDLAALKPQFDKIMAAGNEVGLHGLDAWRDAAAGRREQALVAQILGPAVGVRMHWLYFDGNSPAVLDQAGFSYDSTVGYNETVGYRAGTTQAYRPPGTARLLELPLVAMDTALFYPGSLHLRNDEAMRLVGRMLDDLAQFGGAFTVNWHDRSIAPERLWTDIYRQLVQELKRRGVWFPTAGQAVAWFRKRRAAVVESTQVAAGRLRVRVRLDKPDALPNLKLRIHKPRIRTAVEPLATGPAAEVVDMQLDETTELTIAI